MKRDGTIAAPLIILKVGEEVKYQELMAEAKQIWCQQKNLHFDDDVDWITVNGTHVPLDDDGNAIGGGKLKGEKFSKAKSQKKTTKESSSKSGREADVGTGGGHKLEKRLAEIDADFAKKRDALHAKYGDKAKRTNDIQNDSSLTEQQKKQRLLDLDQEFKRKWEEYDQIASESRMERKKAEKEFGPSYDPASKYKKIEGTHSPKADGKAGLINPKGLRENCQRCAVAFEMRRRGFDVKASPGEGDELCSLSNILSCFSGAEKATIPYSNPQKVKEDICTKMKGFGNGSRGLMTVVYKDGFCHILNVCKSDNGEVKMRLGRSELPHIWNSSSVGRATD